MLTCTDIGGYNAYCTHIHRPQTQGAITHLVLTCTHRHRDVTVYRQEDLNYLLYWCVTVYMAVNIVTANRTSLSAVVIKSIRKHILHTFTFTFTMHNSQHIHNAGIVSQLKAEENNNIV